MTQNTNPGTLQDHLYQDTLVGPYLKTALEDTKERIQRAIDQIAEAEKDACAIIRVMRMLGEDPDGPSDEPSHEPLAKAEQQPSTLGSMTLEQATLLSTDQNRTIMFFLQARDEGRLHCPKCRKVISMDIVHADGRYIDYPAYSVKPGNFQCDICNHNFSIKKGTPMHGSKVTLGKWADGRLPDEGTPAEVLQNPTGRRYLRQRQYRSPDVLHHRKGLHRPCQPPGGLGKPHPSPRQPPGRTRPRPPVMKTTVAQTCLNGPQRIPVPPAPQPLPDRKRPWQTNNRRADQDEAVVAREPEDSHSDEQQDEAAAAPGPEDSHSGEQQGDGQHKAEVAPGPEETDAPDQQDNTPDPATEESGPSAQAAVTDDSAKSRKPFRQDPPDLPTTTNNSPRGMTATKTPCPKCGATGINNDEELGPRCIMCTRPVSLPGGQAYNTEDNQADDKPYNQPYDQLYKQPYNMAEPLVLATAD